MSWDVAALLKSRGIPFVFSTGYDVTNILPELLAGSPVIGKPFRNEEVELRIRQAIASARLERSAPDLHVMGSA
ncbi:hypothetical protein [Phenylobacterium sp.]|uniref:hypothetical protein n=1 Tax=Phenylobacterium sp. TaxID=1871053 RepID=UPI0025D60FEA|nr:hypothetical protein [Phenylobacterium sp.]